MLYKKLSYCVLLFVLALLVACGGGKKQEEEESTPAPSASAPAAGGGNSFDASKATATITGMVMYDGPKVTPAKLPYTPECLQAHGGSAGTEETLIVSADNHLKNALVYVKAGAEKWTFPTPKDPVVLDQKGCDYSPHIIVVQANQPLKIVNSDPFLHNIHPQPKNNPEFNMGQPVKGMEATKTFANPEMIPVKCDVHRWMNAWIPVLTNPLYSVSGDDGSFTIKVPAGTYTIEAWHEKLGTQTQQVTVSDNDKKEVNFTFKAS